MYKLTESNIYESYNNVKQYLTDEKCTKELREMCSNCSLYCGKEHDFEDCKDNMCFKFWLAFNYLELTNSYGG